MYILPVDLERWKRCASRPFAAKKKDIKEVAATWRANSLRIVQSSIGPHIHLAMY
jgi:hypothetical protein